MKKSIMTNFVKFRKNNLTRRKGILSFVVAFTLLLTYLLTASRPVFAGGFPNDAKGISGNGKYYSLGQIEKLYSNQFATYNNLTVITSDTHENSDNFAFCLANGKRFPSFTDEKPKGIYTLVKDINKEQYTKLLKENHKWSSIPNLNQAWDTFSRLSYMYLKDPTDIVKRAWGTDLNTARTYFHQVIQYEIWRYTDGMRVSSDTNIYIYEKFSPQQKKALEMIRTDLYNFTVPYENLEYRFYKPDWVFGLGFQALATVRWKIEPATITVTKKWENVKEGAEKPEVWIQLLKDDKPEGDRKRIEPDKGRTTFEIPNKDEINKYSVKEVDKEGRDWKHKDFTAGQPVNKGNGHFEITNTKKEKPKIKVTFKKIAGDTNKDLAGAHLVLKKIFDDGNGLLIKQWDTIGQPVDIDLDAGSYTLTEEKAPDGYMLAAPVSFYVEEDGQIILPKGEDLEAQNDKTITMVDEKIKEKPTKPSGKLATTVEVDGTKADAQKELELSVATDKVTKTVKDTVVYENLLAGETYKLTGQLMKITADKEEEVATKETTFVADASGNGTTSLEFEDVSLEAGVKYVVYETAESEKEIDFKEGKEKHKVEHKDKDDKAQTVVVTKEKPTKPSGKLATTVEVDGTKADAQKELELSVATDKVTKTVKDTVVYENLLAGETYKLTGQLMKITADKEEEVATKETTFVADASGNGTTSLEFEDVSLEAGVKYVVYETAESEKEIDFKEGKEKHKVEHKDKDDKAQTVVVTKEKPTKPSGKLATTVEVDGTKADAQKELELSVATDKVTKTVKDTVVYENLLAGETYKLTGQLMKITADKEEEVATKETTFVADASGNGTTSLEFEDVSLEAGVKYVVYETAESEKEIDFKEGKEKHKVEHKDKDDKAQTVVVTKEKPTKPSGKLATTVEVDGTKADAQKELELSVATDKVTKTVKDTVVYENLLAGETYKLTGQLMKITADKEEEVATKETTFVADASGNGTTSLEFEDVSLEAGVKYVVYETAESEKEIDFKEGKEKHKVEHKDKDDKAQTVVVTKEKPTKPSGKLATTVEVDGTKADAQKELELSVATDKVTKTVKDTVVYENLLAGETYKLTGQLMKITADKEEEVATKETTFVADASGNGTTSLEFEDVSLEAGVKYVVYETAESEKEIDFKEGKEKHKVEHKDKDDKAQTVVVTKEKPTKPSGKLATTVEVDGTKADAQKELELSVATDKVTKTVKDTVVYENLLAGETYKLTGQLMKITADKEEEVATKETTFVADASGNGTTSLEFEDVSLEAGVKYVVYETAESEKEIDFKEGKEKHKVEHKDKDDKAQTVVVTKEKPTKPSGKLATTVEVDGTKADAQKELELSVATDKVTKTVKDTVVYENLLAGETYKLTGQLMKITADKEEEVATKETTFVADASGNGTTSLEFEDVSLEAGVKYVVYETAESEKEIDFKEGKEKHKVEHKDKDDKAQTVVVTKEKPTKPSGKLATTVEVDGTKADAQKELELSVATDKVTKTVKDTVVYENLLAGETYKLTGQLMKITADKEEEVATKETTFVADASGNGTTSLEFEDVSLEAGVKYVVYETAESEKEIDFKEGKEKHKVEHKDKDDKAQTVVVSKIKPEPGAQEVHFSVDETGQVTVTNVNGNTAVAEGNKLTVTDQTKPVTPPSPEEPGAQEVHFSKVNVGGEEIAGAEIHIKQDDTVVASWVSEAGKTHTLKLKPGHYIFHEAVAPGGYLAVTDIHFSVDETGQVTVTNVNGNTAVAEGNKLTVTDQTKPVTPPSPEEPGAQEVHFSKVNVGGEEIAGAEIHIKQDDTVVASWVSEAGKTHTLKLKPGHYIFHEAVAPGGYLAVTDIHFSVDETGQVTVTNVNGNTAVAEGNKLTVTDQTKPVTPPSPEEPGAQEVHFSKVNVGGEEIAGAEIHIKQDDTVVASWVSEAGKTHTLKLKPGHYIFHEAVAPGGYLAVTDIHFSVDETGQVTVTNVNGNTAVAEGNKLTVTDQTKPVTPPSPEEPGAQEVHFSKVNVGGEEIAGAEIHIKQDDTVVASWVSEAGKTHTLKLKPGHYIFHEAVAPGGYLAVTDIHFSVDETGQVTVTNVNGNTAVAEGNKLTVTDQTKPVTPPSPEEPGAQEVHFSKVNVGGEEIAGAEIHIKQDDTVVASWVSEAGKTHTLKLKPGHYIFHEAVAPGGYLAVTDIHFSVDETGQVTVTNVNGNTAVAEGNKLTVTDQTKPVTPPSPEEPGAQEVHFSKVNVGGEEIAGAEIHIKQDDTVVASWVSEAGKTHTLKLKPGHYIFHEAVAPGGYLAVTDIHFSVDETGQVTVTNVNGNTAVAEGNKLTVTDQTKPVTPPSPEEPGAQEVHFSKVNVGGEEIAGAEIHIKQDDTVVASWVSEAGKTHTLKLKPGHYIFHEAVAPGGYLAVTDIHFSVDETGQVTVTNVNGNTAVAEGNKLTVTDQTKPVTPPSPEEPGAQEVHFSKVNVGGEEIAGAEIHIKQDDTVVASWVSEAGKTHTLKLKPGHYIFHEAVAPGGYLAVTDIHFSVDETGQVTVTNVNGNTAVAEGNKLTVTDQSADKDKQDKLPNTGETTGTYLSILGMITAVFASLLYRSKKK
ncbi:collagen-binding protein A [Streptococcus pneumoniae]|nr:collagen-binding protein A [Streptococcus pneumoniae]